MRNSDTKSLSSGAAKLAKRNTSIVLNSDQTMTVTISIKWERDYQVAHYFLDWENNRSRLAGEMFDSKTLNMIAPIEISITNQWENSGFIPKKIFKI